MFEDNSYIQNINADNFEDIALDVFRKQYEEIAVYKSYVDALAMLPHEVHTLHDIPFLPISFFKTHAIYKKNIAADAIFQSSGTTGEHPSQHFVQDINLYQQAILNGFEQRYGSASDYCFLGLLPSYLEKGNSSLVYMVDYLMKQSHHPLNGFYLDDWQALHEKLSLLIARRQPTILIGVTYALLDFSNAFPGRLHHITIMETGGMKGRKKEMIREAVHQILTTNFEVEHIHSEYGMTELLSQAYALQNGRFFPSSSMKVFIRDMHDPLSCANSGVGFINIIDLANLHSCSFIATEDMGRLYEDGSFEVLGRMDHSALRGCSLMAV